MVPAQSSHLGLKVLQPGGWLQGPEESTGPQEGS